MMFTIAALSSLLFPPLRPPLPFSRAAANGGTSSCSTGDMQCCNSVQSASSPEVQDVAGALDIRPAALLVKLGCSAPRSASSALPARNNCHAQAVCCTNNSYGSLISLGCVPIST
ncbi:fungal hydrophobin-domain-containing protein [Cerioporus squamosus]|nr:fungal hydrophobin-domain-containing protein [Cerioporus squamosus]